MNESTKSQKVSLDNADRSFPSILKIPYSNTNKRMNCISWKERERERESNGHDDDAEGRWCAHQKPTERHHPKKKKEGVFKTKTARIQEFVGVFFYSSE